MNPGGLSMRAVLVVVFLANLVLIAVTTAMMPERVAIHFGYNGEPDNWGARSVNAWAFIGVSTAFFLLFWFMPFLMRVMPRALVNLPNKAYWFQDEHRETAIMKMDDLMVEFGVAFFGFFACVEVLVTMANLSDPVRLNETIFYIALVGFFAYTGWWVYRTLRAFRVPEG